MATATRMLRKTGAAPGAAGSANLLQEMWNRRADYMYVLPALIVMGIVIVYPLIKVIWLSVHFTSPYGGAEQFVGLDNYKEAVQDEHFGLVVRNTIVWTVASTVLALFLGLAVAILLSRPIRFRGFFRSVLFIPYVIGQVTAAFVWKWIFHADFGVISGLLIQMGLISKPIKFIDSTGLVLPSLIVVNVWKEFPFAMVLLLAGLQAIPEQLYNAAKIDGAGRWRRFTDITVPQLMPVITVASILLIITNVNAFTIVWVLTGGGPAYRSQIYITHVYAQAFVGSPHFELASALGVMVFFALMIFAIFYVRALTRQSRSTRVADDTGDGEVTLIGAGVPAAESAGGSE
ncbi:MAG: sugar ABC transporter permease [Chloroflexota bacterium]|nr:sugar ABC transporter permease [Chloroflexota bacterium]